MTPAPTRVDRRAWGAVAVLFVVNGATYNSIVGWFPTLRDALGLSNAELGTAVAAFPGAALVVGVLAGPLIARFGGGRVAVVVGVLGALLLPLVAVASSWLVFAATLFVLGRRMARAPRFARGPAGHRIAGGRLLRVGRAGARPVRRLGRGPPRGVVAAPRGGPLPQETGDPVRARTTATVSAGASHCGK